MDYSKLSDFEINKLVAEKLNLRMIHERAGTVCYTSQGGTSCFFDPCNNPADAWPIIANNEISLVYDGISWTSSSWRDDSRYDDWKKYPEHALRIAMILFLMMN